MTNHLLYANLSKTTRGILLIAPLPVFLLCLPAFNQSAEFGFFYLTSSICFLIALYLSVRFPAPSLIFGRSKYKHLENANQIINNKLVSFILYALLVIFIFSLSSLSLYKIFLVATGQVTSLYTISTKLQVTGDSSFVSRIFTANMPAGLSIGIIFACVTSFRIKSVSSLIRPLNILVVICLLTAVLNIFSSGGVSSLVAIIQIILFVLIAPIYSLLIQLFKNLSLSTKSMGSYVVLASLMIFVVYIINIYSQIKKMDGILDILESYFEQVYNYQYVIYEYVGQAGTSGSGGLGSLFPIQLEAFQSNALSLFKYHLDPILQKGVWLGLTGRQLLEFGQEFQPLVMFFSTLTYFLILRIVANSLLPHFYASKIWIFLVFCSLLSCWTSDPMTGIPVGFFVIIGYTLIVRVLMSDHSNQKLA